MDSSSTAFTINSRSVSQSEHTLFSRVMIRFSVVWCLVAIRSSNLLALSAGRCYLCASDADDVSRFATVDVVFRQIHHPFCLLVAEGFQEDASHGVHMARVSRFDIFDAIRLVASWSRILP